MKTCEITQWVYNYVFWHSTSHSKILEQIYNDWIHYIWIYGPSQN